MFNFNRFNKKNFLFFFEVKYNLKFYSFNLNLNLKSKC